MTIDEIKTKVKQAWEENPVGVFLGASLAITVVSKALEVTNETRNSRAWATEVKRRDRMN